MRKLLLTTIAIGCGSAPPPKPSPPPVSPPPVVAEHPAEARHDFALTTAPMGLIAAAGCLVWTDTAGAIWTMRIAGGKPQQLSEQHSHGFAQHPLVAGGRVFATTKHGLFEIAMPDGPVTTFPTKLLGDPEEAIGDDQAIYVTLFKRNEVMRLPLDGGAATKLFEIPRGVLAVHGDTLYAASYSTGVLVAAPATGGAQKQIAKGLDHPTAIAADDTHVYVYTEKDTSIHRIAIATGESTLVADKLINADEIVLHGDDIYTVSWAKPAQLVRIPKTGGEPHVLAGDLAAPRSIAIFGTSIYVTSRDQNLIVRVPL